MLKLREGDLWKVVILVVLIVGVAWFVSRRVRGALRPPAGSAQPPQVASQPVPTIAEAAPEPAAAAAMYALREREAAADLARAQVTPDPFRPYLSVQSPPGPASAPLPAQEGAEPGASASDLAGFRLTGVISSRWRPLAAFSSGDRRYYLRRGESLPGGWRLVDIGARAVTLTKGNRQIELTLTPAARDTSQ